MIKPNKFLYFSFTILRADSSVGDQIPTITISANFDQRERERERQEITDSYQLTYEIRISVKKTLPKNWIERV